jgi:hypothetical protein
LVNTLNKIHHSLKLADHFALHRELSVPRSSTFSLIFYPENRGSILLRNDGIYVPDHTTSNLHRHRHEGPKSRIFHSASRAAWSPHLYQLDRFQTSFNHQRPQSNLTHALIYRLCYNLWSAGRIRSQALRQCIIQVNLACTGSGSISAQVMWDLWWTKWHCGRFLRALRFPLSFHQLLHTHHLSSGAGTIGQIVAGVPSGLSLNPPPTSKKKINKKFWGKQIAYFPLIRYGPHRKLKN